MAQKNENKITEILKLGDCMRYQDPPLLRSAGKKARWYIRPYIDVIGPDGQRAVDRPRIYFGRCEEVPKAEAIKRKNQELEKINRRTYVLASQLKFSEFLDRYQKNHVEAPGLLAASTQAKYASLIKCHIRPAFGEAPIATISTESIDAFLRQKQADKLSWNTRLDLKNLLSAIFNQARKWGLYREPNPAEDASVGRKKLAREPQKLTVEDTRRLLDALQADVRELCEVGLYCGLRISEIFGLQWKHVNFTMGVLEIRQRYYRGDIDTVKSERSRRDVPMGSWLFGLLLERFQAAGGSAAQDKWVFSVKTQRGSGTCRDDRDVNQHFLRPTAKELGLYWIGFGFHAFRREAVTEYNQTLGVTQAQRLAGHATARMSAHYTLADHARQAEAIDRFQQLITGAKQ